MADNHANNEIFAPPTAEDEEAAWILLSFKDNSTNTSHACINTSSAMTPDKETTQQAAHVRTLEHAISRQAPAPTPASISSTPSCLMLSLGGQAVQKPKTSQKPFTSRLTSDVTTTSGGNQRRVREHVIVSPNHTTLAGRTESNLGQKEKKVVVNQTRRAINASGGDLNNAMDIDFKTDGNNTISSIACSEEVLPSRSIDNSQTLRPKGNAPTTAAAQGPSSLRTGGISGGIGQTPAHKTSINPFYGAQTTTAHHFLQTTANTATVRDDARRPHLNNANELARSLTVAPPVNNYNDFPIIDGDRYAAIEGNGPAPVRQSYQPYGAVAAAAGAQKCSTFRPVYIHTAKCDECNTRNRSVLYRCNTCSTQLDRACMTNNHEHGAHVNSLDWTDHGAQSASKPRGAAGPRVKKTTAKNFATKKKVSVKDEAVVEKQLASNDEKDKKNKKKKTRESNFLSKSTDEAFEDDGFMMLSSRVRIKLEDKRTRSPPPGRKRVGRGAGTEKRKVEEEDIYEMPDDDVQKASKSSRQLFTNLNDGGVQCQQRASAWSKSAQSASPAVPTQNPARSAGPKGINLFFAEADRLKEEYTRVSEELESKKARLAELQAEKDDIEAKITKRMGN